MPRAQSFRAPAAYALLADVPNLAVESALLDVLAELDAEEQTVAIDALIARRRDRGLSGLVGAFERYDSALQGAVLNRADELYGGARVAIADPRPETRFGAIEFLRRCQDTRLAYLLAAALRQPCPKTRARAAVGLLDLAESHLGRWEAAVAAGETSAELATDRAYLARALRDAVEAWDLHHRPEVLTAAIWLGDDLEELLFSRAASTATHLARALVEMLAGRDDARLAGFTLSALRCPDLRTGVARVIETNSGTAFIEGLLAESWRLADPQVGLGALRIRRLPWLTDEWLSSTRLSDAQVRGLARLVASSGLTVDTKVVAFGRLLAVDSPAGRSAIFWQLVRLESQSADSLLRTLTQRQDDSLSAAAARELQRRGADEGRSDKPEIDPARLLDPADPPTFDEFWECFEQLDDSTRGPARDAMRLNCPDLDVRLRARLAASDAGERLKALRLVRELDACQLVAERLYRLASDPDSVVRSFVMSLLAKVDGPTTRLVLRRALDDPDERVQANAVETFDRLGVPELERHLTPKLESKHHRVRANAVAALLKMQVREAATTLLDMLEAPSRTQRSSALWVIERLQLGSMIDRVIQLADADPDPQVQRRAGRILGDLPISPTSRPAPTPRETRG